MYRDGAGVSDDFTIQMDRRRSHGELVTVRGLVVVELFDEFGRIKSYQEIPNLVTTFGDEYIAKRTAAAVSPAAPSDVTKVSKMQLGTGTTAVAKAGAGSTIVTFIANSGIVFDATYPQLIDETGDTGWSIRYKTTWAAGTATNSAITEAVITTQTGVNTAATATDTISRVVFTAIDKQAADSLAITWNHKILGA